MDDVIWEISFHFQGRDNLECKIGESDITYMNFLALIETKGYAMNVSMYYVNGEGKGVSGMELIDGMAKVQKMLKKFETKSAF